MEMQTFDGKVVGSVFVDESGIHKVIEVGDYGEYICETIMPRAAFVEAYNKFILGEGESTSKAREKVKDDVSCQYCKYEDKDSIDYPCCVCMNNHPNMFEWKETRKPNCVDCDHFGNGCNKCEKNEDE